MFVGYGLEILEEMYVGVGGVDDVGMEEPMEAFPPGVGTAKHIETGNSNKLAVKTNESKNLIILFPFCSVFPSFCLSFPKFVVGNLSVGRCR